LSELAPAGEGEKARLREMIAREGDSKRPIGGEGYRRGDSKRGGRRERATARDNSWRLCGLARAPHGYVEDPTGHIKPPSTRINA